MSPPTFDLQSHSIHSDGELAPRAVVAAAAAAGVELLSLTDHDSVDGIAEAAEAATEHGVHLISGVEISTVDRDHPDLHVLGYLIDRDDDALGKRLAGFRADRERRAVDMAQALADLGFVLDLEGIEARVREGKSVGRPHLAAAVLSRSENQTRLIDEGRLDVSPFIEGYLIEGRPAFRERPFPSVQTAIELIHAAGGLAVWAHPFWDVPDPAEVLSAVDRFAELGLDGVEAFYVTHSEEQTTLLAEHCARAGLLTTGSSDFHGPDHRLFSGFRAFATFGRTPDLGPIGA